MKWVLIAMSVFLAGCVPSPPTREQYRILFSDIAKDLSTPPKESPK